MECRSLSDTAKLANDLALKLNQNNQEKATVVALFGNLGSGKTTFSQFVASALGVKQSVQSPTFVIQKIYDLEGQAFDRLIHIDTYRLEGEKDIDVLNFDDLLSNPRNLILIEWPEKIIGRLPENRVEIYFEGVNEDCKKIEIKNVH